MILASLHSFRPTTALDRAGLLASLSRVLRVVAVVQVIGVTCLSTLVPNWAMAASASAPSTSGTSSGSWSSLHPTQRTALAPLEKDWATIDASHRSKWLEIAARFPTMAPAEQQRVQGRMTEWARLSPSERGRARLSFQEAKQLSPQERQARWEAYQALPDTQRKALAARASASAPPLGSGAASGPLTANRGGVVSGKSPGAAIARPVAPTLVQAGPGATTTSIAKGANPPAHQTPGQPRIAARPGQVDRATLLPHKPATVGATPTAETASKPNS